MKPNMRPARPDFSSGPCAKRPGWTPEVLKDAALGRSHRSKLGKKKIVEAVDRTRALLGIPADYRIGIVPASDTGAVEMALWSLLGARPVDMLTWESFGEGWVTDVAKQLKLKDARVLKAPYGQIANPSRSSAIQSPFGTFTPEVVPFQVKTTSRVQSTCARSAIWP